MLAGRAPGEHKWGILPGFSPHPGAARDGTGGVPTALTPKAGPPQPRCSCAGSPVSPPMLLTPPQGAVVPFQPGDGTAAAVGYSRETAPVSSGKCRRDENLAGSRSWSRPAPCTGPGSVEQALAWLPGQRHRTGVWTGSPWGPSPRRTEQGGGWSTPTCPLRRAGSPRYMDQRDFHASKPALKHVL